MSAVLLVEHLTKDYGSYRALDDVSFAVKPGEVVGLLGPNGSGKTTALRIALGFMRPSSGTTAVAGFDSWSAGVEARRRVAYLPGELRLYENMSGRRLITFLGNLRGEQPGKEVDALARKLDIDIDRPLVQMSSGMKRKVALLTVLLPKVPLIILDEPTNTLDPTMRDELLAQLHMAKAEGKAVLFSSHVLQEVEAVCDRVLFLRKGVLVHVQEMNELRDGRRVSLRLSGPSPIAGPNDAPLPPEAIRGKVLSFDYRGDVPSLLSWLTLFTHEDLRIGPLGLGPIYKKFFESESASDGYFFEPRQ